MTQWILVDRTLSPDHRPVLASCETFRKRCLVSGGNAAGKNVSEGITHGVASVYCPPDYRERGYASRMLRELGKTLEKWQVPAGEEGEEEEKGGRCVASVLYSDIGGRFYERLGWVPRLAHHFVFEPGNGESPKATPVFDTDLEKLCLMDEVLVRTVLEKLQVQSQNHGQKARFAILPDAAHMRWHHAKEDFACIRLFGKVPEVKGAIAGEGGKRVWAIWTHRFYGCPGNAAQNVLYILRLGMEVIGDGNEDEDVVRNLGLVLHAAMVEANEWNLHHVQLWDPSSVVARLVQKTGIPYRAETRTNESLGCLRWYGREDEEVEWLYNEKYAWC